MSQLIKELKPVLDQVVEVRKQAKKLGIFTGERDLLSCPSCGLEEDVTFEGILIVTSPDDRSIDTKLRFKQAKNSEDVFTCPNCKRSLSGLH